MSVSGRLASAFDRGSRPIAIALLLLALAIVMPPIPTPRTVYEHIVVFDVTQSMNVRDYEIDGKPVSRLDYAREAMRRALRALPCGSRIGWGAFAEYRTILLLAPVEVCGNYDALTASLGAIDGRLRWSNASEVTKGVFWAMRAAKALSSRPDVIFVTDGHEAPPIDPQYPPRMFEDLASGEVRGWLIGAGGDAARPIPKMNADGAVIGYWRAFEVVQTKGGREHLSSLKEAHLERLARDVGFNYTRLSDLDSIAEALRDPRSARRTWAPVNGYWLPALAALLLLAYRWSGGVGRRSERRWAYVGVPFPRFPRTADDRE